MMIPTLAGGGAEHVFLNLAVGFKKAGYQVDLILKRASGEYLSQLPEGINLIDLNASGMLATLAGVRGYLRSQHPRVLLAGLDIPNLAAILARKISGSRTKVIVSVRSVISQQRRFFLPHRSLERAFMALIYPQANRILANSQGAAQDFSSYLHIPLSRVQVIYNPVITDALLEKAGQPLEHDWFRAGEPPVILSAGRLNTVKDFPTLIKAFARIWQNTPARLLILGEGDRRSELEALVLQLGLQEAILLPGFQQNPFAFMRRAAAFVLPSIHDASPNVLIEAMACGCPVVATDSLGGSGELTGYGKYGHLVPVGDDAAMAQAILDVLSGDVRKPPSEWLSQFELANIIQQYLDII